MTSPGAESRPKARQPIDPASTVGGQAVIEGVMMRAPGAWAVAVRRPDGLIEAIRNEEGVTLADVMIKTVNQDGDEVLSGRATARLGS